MPYGTSPIELDLGDRPAWVIDAPPPPPARDAGATLAAALDAPVDSPPLEDLVRAGDRVTLIVSDATRDEPRDAMVAAIRARLPACRLTLAIATGTHGRCRVARLRIDPARLAGAAIVDHDGNVDDDLVDVGATSRGTPVRLHRALIEADTVVATGCIRPHYFAGWGAGAKAIFPGLGQTASIRQNHRLKAAPGAVAGAISGNPCRDDLEEAARLIPGRRFLLNVLGAPTPAPASMLFGAVAGSVEGAWRAGANIATPWFTATGQGGAVVVASDALPVTASLYQAAKIVAAVAPLAVPGGAIVIVAECVDGIGPVEVVNRAIFELGIQPRLPPDCTVFLVSGMPLEVARAGFAIPRPTVQSVLVERTGPVVIVPRASQLLIRCAP